MGITNIDYMNYYDALQRLGGNEKLYKKLLLQFLGSDYSALIESAVESGDVQEVKARVHTVKGVSSNLSLGKVYQHCVNVEEKIHDNLDYTADYKELKAALSVTAEIITDFTKEG